MPTALELLDQHSKHIDKLNVDIANLHKTIAELNKVIDEQTETIDTYVQISVQVTKAFKKIIIK